MQKLVIATLGPLGNTAPDISGMAGATGQIIAIHPILLPRPQFPKDGAKTGVEFSVSGPDLNFGFNLKGKSPGDFNWKGKHQWGNNDYNNNFGLNLKEKAPGDFNFKKNSYLPSSPKPPDSESLSLMSQSK